MTVDNIAPTVSSVSAPANGTYKVGDNLNFTVNLSEVVTVNTGGGTPYIALTIGETIQNATYLSGSGTSALVFRYTVQVGDLDTDGIAVGTLSTGGGTIRDDAGNDAALTLNSVGSTTSVLVDGVAPTVSSVTGPSNGTYAIGDNLDFTATFSDYVTVSGMPYITLMIGSSTVYAMYAGGSGTTALVFRYTVASGDYDADGITCATPITLNLGTIRDAASNDATLTFTAPTTTAVLVDAVSPVVTASVGTTAFTEGAGVTSTPVAVDAGITVTDPDSATLSSATVSITGNFHTGEDVLAFTNDGSTMGNIAVADSYNATTGVLTLTSAGATATVAQWQAALWAVTYTNFSETPNTATRTVSFVVNDGSYTSLAATKSVSVMAVNDAPVVTGAVSGQAVDDNATISPFTAVTITDVDSVSLTVTVTLDTAAKGALSRGSGSYNDGTGVYTMTGTPAAVAADIAGLVFIPAANRKEPGSTETTTFTIGASDGTASATNSTTTVVSTSVNNAPTDITLSASAILAIDTGLNAVVGTLGTTDVDTGEMFTYLLADGTGDTDNGSFNIDVTSLQTNGALAVGTYSVRIRTTDANGATYEEAFSISVTNAAAKSLTADVTGNSVDNDLVITFAADATFEAAVTGVSINGTALTPGADYTVGSGTITLKPGGGNSALCTPVTPATPNVTVTATGYENSTVSQTLTAGAVASLVVSTQPVPGAETGDAFATQPVITLKDQYGNICTDGTSAAANVTAAATAAATAGMGTWTIDGTTTRAAVAGVATFTDLTCTHTTSGNGALTFTCAGKTVDSDTFVIPERDSSISPATANFDRYLAATNYADIAVTMTLNSNTLTAIRNGTTTLVLNTDYTVSGSDCTIKKEYLKTLSSGTAQLTFDFSLGVDRTLAVTVTDTTPSDDTPPTPPAQTAVVEVNGKQEQAGTTQTKTEGGTKTTTVTVDEKKIEDRLNAEGNNATVVIPVNTGANVVVGQLTGQTVKSMEAKEATLEIKTGTVTYTLPASQINIDNVSDQIGKQVELKDIKVNISIAEPPADTVKLVEDTASKGGYQLVVKPVEFEITCTSGDTTVSVSRFNGYVERTVAIPDDVDPSLITTGVVLNADGTFSHVPTTIVMIDGKYYAKINSLTNSTYSVIYNQVEFADIAGHWAQDAIRDMGSRLVVTGVGEDNYAPGREITRAEFATILVRALGLKPTVEESSFADVPADSWYCGYVQTASDYGIVTGYGNGSFGPADTITREQAMVMLARAMKLTGLDPALTDAGVAAILAEYPDGGSPSDFAAAGVADCLDVGVVTGTGTGHIAPMQNITRAEVAVMVQRLLQYSGLI